MKTPNDPKQREAGELKEKFLKCFGVRAANAMALRGVVKGLIDQGVTRKTLVIWAVQAGYTKGYVSSLLSRILCLIGCRERRVGAGRKPSPDALELLAHSQNRYGQKFLNVLRAAWRAGKAQVMAEQSAKIKLIVAPQITLPSRKQDDAIQESARQLKCGARLLHREAERRNFKRNLTAKIGARARTDRKRL
jgi:hypothetical protein